MRRAEPVPCYLQEELGEEEGQKKEEDGTFELSSAAIGECMDPFECAVICCLAFVFRCCLSFIVSLLCLLTFRQPLLVVI